eukprot:752982-Hanusia_phi.AAC.4
MVSRDWQVGVVLEQLDDVEVGHARLDLPHMRTGEETEQERQGKRGDKIVEEKLYEKKRERCRRKERKRKDEKASRRGIRTSRGRTRPGQLVEGEEHHEHVSSLSRVKCSFDESLRRDVSRLRFALPVPRGSWPDPSGRSSCWVARCCSARPSQPPAAPSLSSSTYLARSRVESVAERTVEGGGILGGVGNDGDVGEAIGIERVSDRPDPPVHHVRRCHHVSTCAGLSQRLPAQLLDRLVVEDPALAAVSPLVRAHHAIVSLVRVRIQRHVRPDVDGAAVPALDLGDEGGNETCGIVALVRAVGLELLGDLWEQDDVADSLRHGLSDLSQAALLRVALAAWHGVDLLVAILGVHEERVNEVGRLDSVLSNH